MMSMITSMRMMLTINDDNGDVHDGDDDDNNDNDDHDGNEDGSKIHYN